VTLKKKKETKDSEISAWKTRIERSKNYQTSHAKTWARNDKLLFGESEGVRQQNTVAYGWGLVQALMTAIYVQNPNSIMEPYDKTSSFDRGTMWSSIMQYDFDMMDLKSIGNLGLVDNFVAGYFACIEAVETDKSYHADEVAKKMYAMPEAQRYCARRIIPKDILFDWQGTRLDLSDSRFVIVAWYPTVSQLLKEKDGDFPDLPSRQDLMDLKTAYPDERNDPNSQKMGETRKTWNDETDPDFKTICVWEIWDKVNKKVVYVLDDTYVEIGSVDWPATFLIGQRDMFPVTLMGFHPMTRGLYPKPELDLIANQLGLLNLIDSIIYADATTKWRKLATLSGLISPDKAAKIVSLDPENALILIEQDALEELAQRMQHQGLPDLRGLVVPIQDPQVKQDLLLVRDMIRQEINDIIGYGPPERGGMPATRSAREAVAIKEKLDARLAKRADAVAEFYRLFGTKHFLLLQQTMMVERYARVFSFVNGAEFKAYQQEDLKGSFNFRVFAGTSGPMTTEAKQASELQLFQTLMPLIQTGQIPPEPPIMRLAESFQWVGVGQLLKNYVPATQELAMLLSAMQTQPDKIPPNALPEAAAKVVMAVLTPQQIQAIQTGMQGMTPSGKAQQARPAPAPKSVRGDPDALATGAAQ